MSTHLFLGCAALAAGLLQGQPVPVELAPLVPIDLRPALAKHVPDFGHILGFSVVQDTLHMLVRPSPRSYGPFAVVRMDLAGNVRHVVPIQGPLEERWFLTDERTGDGYVWRRAHPTRPGSQEIVYRVTAEGRTEEAAVFERRLQLVARWGSDFLGLGNSMCLPANIPCNLGNADPSGRAGIFLPFSQSELISIEPFIPAVVRLNPSNGRVISRRIIAPEVVHHQSRMRTNPAGAAMFSSYTVAQGSLWAIAMGQPMAKGAAVLRFNGEGDVQESLRCELAKDEAFASGDNPDGFMFPSAVAVSSGKLYVLDGRGLLSICALSPRT